MKIELADGKIIAMGASVAAVALGVAAGYVFGREQERKLHALDVVEELIGDTTAPALTSAHPVSHDEFDDLDMPVAGTPVPETSESEIKRSSSVSSLRSVGSPPRPPKRHHPSADAGRATSGVVVHIDEARRKMSLDQSVNGPIIMGVAGG